jgi:uncharacterized protein (TIGR02145 family)
MTRFIVVFILVFGSFCLIAQQTAGFTDPRDGKTYKTVTIDSQTWFAENLAFKPVTGNCWFLKNDQANLAMYGYLYDWETAKNACPAGWRLPTESDFMILVNFLGGERVAGGKLKSVSEWASPNTGATDESGFAALPGGMRELSGAFTGVGNYSDWWTSAESGGESARYLGMRYNGSDVGIFNSPKNTGHYVRCLKN